MKMRIQTNGGETDQQSQLKSCWIITKNIYIMCRYTYTEDQYNNTSYGIEKNEYWMKCPLLLLLSDQKTLDRSDTSGVSRV